MDYDKLIRRLRNDADAYRDGKTLGRAFAVQEDVLDNAATAIETLRADLARATAELVEADREGRCVVFQPDYPVVSTYHKDESGRVIREVAGVVSAEEYDAALKAREQE